MGKISLGSGTSGSATSPALFTCSLSDQPFDKIAYTPLLRIASTTHFVMDFGSETTMDPKPIYTIFLFSARAVSMNLSNSGGGVHFLALTSASSKNQ